MAISTYLKKLRDHVGTDLLLTRAVLSACSVEKHFIIAMRMTT
jgi:hypothetical protein